MAQDPSTPAEAPGADVVGAIMAVEAGEASPLETLETFGLLIKTGAIRGLQGSWQRSVSSAIDAGLIDTEGNLTDHALDILADLDETPTD